MSEVAEKLKMALGTESILEARTAGSKRQFVLIKPEVLRQAVTHLYKNCQFWHLATVTGVDLGENFEITYHLDDGNTLISLKTRVPKSAAKIGTVTDIIPGAVLYERELYEMFGVVVEGHPDPRPVMLPDGWPKDLYPLRKEVTLEKIKERLGEGAK